MIRLSQSLVEAAREAAKAMRDRAAHSCEFEHAKIRYAIIENETEVKNGRFYGKIEVDGDLNLCLFLLNDCGRK